jgi:hypothetical protein
MRLNNFKQFNESEKIESNILFSKDELKDIFADILDEGYELKIHTHTIDYSFFELEKSFDDHFLGAMSKNSIYGYTNIDNIVSEYNKLSILEGIKNRLNSMGYNIGFEFESNLTTTSDRTIKIICHLEYDIDLFPLKYDLPELSEEEIDDLDDEEYEEYMKNQ